MKRCTICNETKEQEQFSRGQNKCKRCRSKTKEPEIPATDCNYLITKGKKAGQWCNETIIEQNKCKKHLKKEVLPTGCVFVLSNVNGISKFCNKDKHNDLNNYCTLHDAKSKENKHCSKCDIILTETNSIKDRKQCKDCRKKSQENSLSKRTEDKICKTCNLSKPMTQYDGYHAECNNCRCKSGPVIPKEIIIKKFENTNKKCILCHENKNITDFAINGNTYRNQCRKCLNMFKYYIKYRQKKMDEDPIGFKQHNAELSKIWRNENIDKLKYYARVYNNTEEGMQSIYISSAKAKNLLNIDINIFKQLIKKLINEDCFYCGKKTEFGSLADMTIGNYNGIDRLNSSLYYNEENCVSCCKKCNFIKNTLDIGSFIRKCLEIDIFNGNKTIKNDSRLQFHSDLKLVGNSSNFYVYKTSAEKRNKKFNITSKQFLNIIKNQCYICGLSNKNGVGVDRVDNSIGYELENCKPCCSYCNFMKKDLNLEEFIDHIRRIVAYSITDKHLELGASAVLNRFLNLKKELEENDIELGELDDEIDCDFS